MVIKDFLFNGRYNRGARVKHRGKIWEALHNNTRGREPVINSMFWKLVKDEPPEMTGVVANIPPRSPVPLEAAELELTEIV